VVNLVAGSGAVRRARRRPRVARHSAPASTRDRLVSCVTTVGVRSAGHLRPSRLAEGRIEVSIRRRPPLATRTRWRICLVSQAMTMRFPLDPSHVGVNGLEERERT
jgi:hypothetical protein